MAEGRLCVCAELQEKFVCNTWIQTLLSANLSSASKTNESPSVSPNISLNIKTPSPMRLRPAHRMTLKLIGSKSGSVLGSSCGPAGVASDDPKTDWLEKWIFDLERKFRG